MGDLELGEENYADRGTNLTPRPGLGPRFGSNHLLWADARSAGRSVHGLLGFGHDALGVWGEE